ncbi:hypothetical protein ACI65C_001438 [Semiaphis heraclei]
MPRSLNVPTSPKVINKHADKNKNSNAIQAARLIKNSTNNPMLNSIDPTSIQVENTDAGWTQKTSKRNHSDSSEPKSPDPTSNKKNNNKLFITTNRYEVLTQTEPAATIIEADAVSEGSIITDHIKPPPPIFMKRVLDFHGFSSSLINKSVRKEFLKLRHSKHNFCSYL